MLKTILRLVECFYKELFLDQHTQRSTSSIPKILNVGSEEIPEITLSEITTAPSELKRNEAPGEDGITIEAIKYGG